MGKPQRSQTELARLAFDAYAEEYEDKFNRNPLGRYQRRRVQAELRPFLKTARRILDVGCGPGSDFAFYRDLELSVDALDLSPRMVALARQRAAQLGLSGNIYCSSLADFRNERRYDAVLLNFGVINAVDDPAGALDKISALVRPGGVIALVFMPPFHLFSLLGSLLRGRFRSARRRLRQRTAVLPNGLTVHYYRPKDIRGDLVLLKKIHLAALLPTPDQYQRYRWAQRVTRGLMKWDHRLAALLPAVCGGDHLCCIFQRPSGNELP